MPFHAMLVSMRTSATRDAEGRLVLVKRAEPGPPADRLRREARALAHAPRGVCVALLEVGDEPDGGARLVTAWAGGGSLATALPPGPQRAARIAARLAAGLAELHAAGVVHGRVAPEHVVLDEGDRPLLCGLGSARLPGEEGGPEPDADVAGLLAVVSGLVEGTGGPVAERVRAAVAVGSAGGAAAAARRLAEVDAARPPPRRELRPRRPAPPTRASARPLVVASLAAGLLLALAVAVAREPGGTAARRAEPATTTTTTTVAAPSCGGGPASGPDVDGDRCPDDVAVQAGVVTADGARWRVGEPADLAAVADWDCDGRATAAVVRPATGEVWVYDGWAPAGATATARPVPAVPDLAGAATARAVVDDEGCARLEVATGSGVRQLLELD
jgi:hypothetical protein